jgi:hypothetical protein
MAEDANITRRSVFRGLPLAAIAASLPALAQDMRSAHERVEFHIAELQKALTDLEVGPLEVRLQSDQGASIETLSGQPFMRGTPKYFWRVDA